MKRTIKIFAIILLFTVTYGQNLNDLNDFRLKKIFFKGNETYTKRQLKRYVDIRPAHTRRAMKSITYRYIKSQAKSLQNYYISEGFLNCSVEDSLIINEGNTLHLFFNIKENERYRIKQISIEGNTLLTDGEILELLGVKVGEPFRQYVYYNNFRKILSRYSELGHPFAGIREEYEWGTDMEITLYINEDESYSIKKISLSGNNNVGSRFITKHYLIKENEPYQLDKINRTKDRIYEMGAFNSVNIVPVNPDTAKQDLDLKVSVIESKPRRFDVEFGARQKFIAKDGSDVGQEIYVSPAWAHKNLFNRAHRFRVSAEAGLLYSNDLAKYPLKAEMSYTVPWFLILRLPTTFKLYYNKFYDSPFADPQEDINNIDTEYGINMSNIWRYNRNIYTRASFSLKNVLYNEKTDFDLETEISLQSRFDNRDNFIYPGRGWNILLYTEYVLGAEAGSETEYFRLEASINKYFRLARNMVLAARFEAGQFFDMNEVNAIPKLSLYQMGSESTVRGWNRSIGNEEVVTREIDGITTIDTIYIGKAKMMANLELRFDLPWNFGFDVFLDVGRLDNDMSRIFEWDTYYVNTGLGIYTRTPIGPIRIEFPIRLNDPDIALNRDQDKTFWNSINFGLLFAF